MAKEFEAVFIGGSGRSGTTIVLNTLHRHPDFHASSPREIKYLTSRFGLVELCFGRPLAIEESFKAKKNNISLRFYDLLGRDPLTLTEKQMFGWWWSEIGKKGNPRGLVQGIELETLRIEFAKFKADFKVDRVAASARLFTSLSAAQMKDGEKRFFGDSTPVNIMQANLIERLLPGSKFVNVIRDGRDVAASVVKEKWGPNDHFEALDWWKNRVLQGHKALAAIPKSQKIEVRIEDLVVFKRDEKFRELQNFFQLGHSEVLNNYFAEEILPEKLHAGRWKSEVENPVLFEKKYLQILKRLKSRGISIENFN